MNLNKVETFAELFHVLGLFEWRPELVLGGCRQERQLSYAPDITREQLVSPSKPNHPLADSKKG